MVVRTRACQPCRRRRMKCDATLPQCQQCIRAKRECPGLLGGPIFIDMTASVISKVDLSKATSKNSQPEERSCSLTYVPSPGGMIEQMFISKFIAFQCYSSRGSIQTSWLYTLAESPVEKTGPALALSLRATSTAYCGISSSNRDAVIEACKIYGKALQLHASVISRAAGAPDAWMVGTSVTLSLFEAMWSTNAAAYCSHLLAAAKMLKLAKTSTSSYGLLKSLSIHIQFQQAFVLITGDASLELYEIDLEDLVASEPGSALQVNRLQVSFLALTRLYYQTHHGIFPQAETLQSLETIKTAVEELWSDYQNEAHTLGEIPSWVQDGQTHYRNAFTAMTIAYFEAAKILISVIGFPNINENDQEQNAASCRSILDSATFLETKGIGCAFLRMLLPLLLVGLHSPLQTHRILATSLLDEWQGKTPLAGLGSLAVRRINTLPT